MKWTLSLLLTTACGHDMTLAGGSTSLPPRLTIEAPEQGAVLFVDDPLSLRVSFEDPDGDGAKVKLYWSASSDGPISGTESRTDTTATLEPSSPLSIGDQQLVALALDEDGGVARAAIDIRVVDPDQDDDGHLAPQYGGDDCRDDDPTVYPGAEDVCDGFDQDCDDAIDEDASFQIWYLDADGDGYGDPFDETWQCGAPQGRVTDNTDCDDGDPLRHHCRSCAHLRDSLWDTGDGLYVIDPGGGEEVEVRCDMSTGEGGWTLIGTTIWSQDSGEIWQPQALLDSSSWGTQCALEEPFKSPAWSSVPVLELRFETDAMWAEYHLSEEEAYPSFREFLASVPMDNCPLEDDTLHWPMVDGTLDSSNLCSTDLYVHPRDHDGDDTCQYSNCTNNGYGPTWSVSNNNGCPLDDPLQSDLAGITHGPWDNANPLRIWVHAPVELP